MFVRRSSGFGLGSLSGSWFGCGFSNNHTPPDTGGNVGLVDFDGLGGWTSSSWWNVDGAITASAPGAGTYEVDPDGSCRIRFGAGAELAGVVHPGGNLVVVSGGTAAGNWPTTYVLVRRSSGVTAATVTGSYALVGLGYDPGDDEFISRTGTVVADGAGGFDERPSGRTPKGPSRLPLMPMGRTPWPPTGC